MTTPTTPRPRSAREISRRLGAMQRTFAGSVLVISEFGAESNGLNPAGSPGSYSFQSSLLARHIRAYAADPRLSGMFVYLLRDYPLVPTFQGGSIHGVLPQLRLIEGLNREGAVHLRRARQAGGRRGREVVSGARIGIDPPRPPRGCAEWARTPRDRAWPRCKPRPCGRSANLTI